MYGWRWEEGRAGGWSPASHMAGQQAGRASWLFRSRAENVRREKTRTKRTEKQRQSVRRKEKNRGKRDKGSSKQIRLTDDEVFFILIPLAANIHSLTHSLTHSLGALTYRFLRRSPTSARLLLPLSSPYSLTQLLPRLYLSRGWLAGWQADRALPRY
ncbi:hypothetical protein IWX50DRAFT_629310 [Phyllosticta citricarpa]